MDIFEELNGYGDYDGKNFILFTFFAFLRRMVCVKRSVSILHL